MTNASLKQWVVVLLLPKIDRTHKNYLTTEIWEETHLREIFYGTLSFQQSSIFVLAAMLEGILLPSNMVARTIFCLYHVKCFIVKFRCAISITTSSFQHFPRSLSAKFGVYLSVRTCELFVCFVAIVRVRIYLCWLLCFLCFTSLVSESGNS